jgi:hypothetical protein
MALEGDLIQRVLARFRNSFPIFQKRKSSSAGFSMCLGECCQGHSRPNAPPRVRNGFLVGAVREPPAAISRLWKIFALALSLQVVPERPLPGCKCSDTHAEACATDQRQNSVGARVSFLPLARRARSRHLMALEGDLIQRVARDSGILLPILKGANLGGTGLACVFDPLAAPRLKPVP